MDGGSKPCPPVAATDAFDRLPLLSLLAFLCFRKQSMQVSYGVWLLEPLWRLTKSKKSWPHLQRSFLGRVPLGGPPAAAVAVVGCFPAWKISCMRRLRLLWPLPAYLQSLCLMMSLLTVLSSIASPRTS